MELRDRAVLVTGAGRRIGRAIAVRLARAGCRVAVHYNRSALDAEGTAALCRTAGARETRTFQADLTDLAAAKALPGTVVAEFGRLDVLINNASSFEPMTVDEFDVQDWRKTLEVNLTAPMVLVDAARSALRQARGRVVNLCDAATARPWPTHIAYMVSKAGLEMLTRVLARALAPDVNVVAIAPGVAAWPDNYDAATRARLTAKIPLKREGTPEDVAEAVHFVLSAGDYITGAIVPVDGGRHLT